VSWLDLQGVESGLTGPVTTAALAGSHGVTLSGIPNGPAGVIAAKRIYRSKHDASTAFLLGTIADNSTTTFSDSPGVADATLGTGVYTQVTAGVLSGISSDDV